MQSPPGNQSVRVVLPVANSVKRGEGHPSGSQIADKKDSNEQNPRDSKAESRFKTRLSDIDLEREHLEATLATAREKERKFEETREDLRRKRRKLECELKNVECEQQKLSVLMKDNDEEKMRVKRKLAESEKERKELERNCKLEMKCD